MTLRAYRDFDPNDPENYTNQQYDTGNDAVDFQGTFLEQNRYAYREQQPMMPKSRMGMVAAVLGLVAIAFAAAFAISANSGSDMPIIKADTTAYKAKPETPGGIEIPFQDKLVFNRLDPNGQPVQAERLLPPTEEPMTLALQPKEREAAMPTPQEQLAVEETAVTARNTNQIVVAAKPVVEPAVPAEKLEKLAPVAGAIPAPINEPAPVAAKPVETTAVAVAETPAPMPEKKAEVVATPAAKPAAPVAGGSRVQLASLPEKAAAERALSKLKADYAGALGGASMNLVRADIPGKGTYWRVQSQPMDRTAAEKICNAVKAKGGACLLAK